MTCDLALRFIYSAVSAAMGCLFGCFRIRSDRCPPRTHHVSEPAVSISRRSLASPNQFTSLLVPEVDDESLCEDKRNQSSGFQQTEITDRDLQDEAKFLKACGVLAETPNEIRKTKQKLQLSENQDFDPESPAFHSWYPDISVEKLSFKTEGQSLSLKPLKLCGECPDGESTSEPSTDRCITEMEDSPTANKKQCADLASNDNIQENDLDNSPLPNSTQFSSAAVKSRAKSVRFAREPETPLMSSSICLSEKVGRNHRKVEMPGCHGDLNYSPHPTPLKLSDEMQTPGTIYASGLDSATKGRNARIRSQYVYAALNPVANTSQWRILKEEETEGEMEEPNSDPSQLPDSVLESSEHLYDTPSHLLGKEKKDLADKSLKVEASLSAWLRAPPSTTSKNTKSHEAPPCPSQNIGLTPGSRPILGVLPASYWNIDGSSDMSRKYWDGNGIPNTTTKYKEDQKVKWHATPFEERLEKALSADGSIPERRLMDGLPIGYEDEEDEWAEESPLQSATLPTEAGLPFGEHHIDIVS